MFDMLESIRKDLIVAVDPSSRDAHKRYFKEEVKFYGVKAVQLHGIAKRYWPQVKMLDKAQLF